MNYQARNPVGGKGNEVSVEQMLKEMKPTGPNRQEINNFKHGIDPKIMNRHHHQENLKSYGTSSNPDVAGHAPFQKDMVAASGPGSMADASGYQ